LKPRASGDAGADMKSARRPAPSRLAC
jgi:hypothetical protein